MNPDIRQKLAEVQELYLAAEAAENRAREAERELKEMLLLHCEAQGSEDEYTEEYAPSGT